MRVDVLADIASAAIVFPRRRIFVRPQRAGILQHSSMNSPTSRLRPSLTLVAGILLGAALLGCQTPETRPIAAGGIPFKKGAEVPPVVAVADLENQANFTGQFNLGHGMADMLVTGLMKTKKVVVLERQNLRDILGELSLQKDGLSRPEGRVAGGRLKNARYLIRGSITDFTEVESTAAKLGVSSLKIFGGAQRAQVALHLRIYDVESGEIMASLKSEGNASSGGAGAAGQYKNVTLGGEAFKRTPLGKATEQAIKEAVDKLLKALPVDYWRPLVAEVEQGTVVVNGGDNVRLQPGDQFIVRGQPRFVTDPATGNVIDTIPGQQNGRIQIVKVSPLSATATLLEGTAQRGQMLEPVPK